MVGDCPDEASSDCVTLKFIDPGNLTGNPADLANKGSGVVHSLTRPAERRTGVACQINATNRR